MKKLIEGYFRFNDWFLRFFFKDHVLITSALIGVGVGSIIEDLINGIRRLVSLRKSS